MTSKQKPLTIPESWQLRKNADFRKMYLMCFNAMTDAINALEKNEPLYAIERLKRAQIRAEEMYISVEDGAEL